MDSLSESVGYDHLKLQTVAEERAMRRPERAPAKLSPTDSSPIWDALSRDLPW